MTNCRQSHSAFSILILRYVLTLVLLSVISGLFEYSVYADLLRKEALDLAFFEKAAIFAVLVVKSLAEATPFLLVTTGLLFLRQKRLAHIFIVITTCAIFSWIISDVICFRFAGNHVSDYIPNIVDIVAAPGEQQWQWMGQGMIRQIGMVLGGVSLVIVGTLFATGKLAIGLSKKLSPLKVLIIVGIIWIGFILGMVPTLAAINCEDALRLVYAALPMDTLVLQNAVADFKYFRDQLHEVDIRPDAGLVSSADPQSDGLRTLILENATEFSINLNGSRLQDAVGRRYRLKGNLKPGQGANVSIPMDHITSESDFLLVDQSGTLQYRSRLLEGGIFSKIILKASADKTPSQTINVDMEEGLLDKTLIGDTVHPKPVDSSAALTAKKLPNVILITIESLHFSAIGSEMMPKLHALAEKGFRLMKHYSSSNTSELGIYSLLFGRAGITYIPTLKAKIPAQMCFTLGKAGYHRSFILIFDSLKCKH